MIVFWVERDPDVAEHEYTIHVAQIERLGGRRYLASWVGIYVILLFKLRSFRRAYYEHPMELSPLAP